MDSNPQPSSSLTRPLAVVTGASSGIGFALAKCCAQDGFDLVIAADEAEIEAAATHLRREGIHVEALQVDLATPEGIDRLVATIGERPVDALLANAGRGLGKGFLDQNLSDARRVVDTNITGTIMLVHALARRMRDRGEGRILLTGSIAGFMPGSYQAVYNATKAFVDSFAYALANELKDTGVTVTCLMPGATATRFFERADLLDTKIGTGEKDNPMEVAHQGYVAMMAGRPGVVTGLKNKVQAVVSHITPAPLLAEMHRKQTAPGTANAHAAPGKKGTIGALIAIGALALVAASASRWGRGSSRSWR